MNVTHVRAVPERIVLSCVQMERDSLSPSLSPRMAPWEEAAVLGPLR